MHGLLGKIISAVLTVDVITNFPESSIGNARRVSSHVGDETDGTFGAKLNAFVKLLREHHRLLHCKTEFARSFLLQFRSNEWRDRIAFPFLRGYISDDERLLLRFSDDRVSLRLIIDEDLVLLELLIE